MKKFYFSQAVSDPLDLNLKKKINSQYYTYKPGVFLIKDGKFPWEC